MTATVPGNSLRSCGGCNAHILTNDTTSPTTFCNRCKPKHVKPFDEWAAGLKAGDRVYLQPYESGILSHSQWLVLGRDGDVLAVQVLGMPSTRRSVHVNHTGQQDLTPRGRTGAP
jgi:hypothetical protein